MRITSVTDRDGNVTTFERGVVGGDLVITGTFGQQTVITLDANGYVESIANPGGETTSFLYTPDGLMTKVTDPRNNDTDYTYSAEGRLESTADPVGGGHMLTRTDIPGGFEVLAETAEGVQTAYKVEFQSTGDELRTTLLPDGTQRRTLTGVNRTVTTIDPSGSQLTQSPCPDPRFGMQSYFAGETTLTTSGGITSATFLSRDAVVTNPSDPLSLSSFTETVTVDGRSLTRVYDSSTKTLTTTSPEQRRIVSSFDANGRLTHHQVGDLDPVVFSYGPEGRFSAVSQAARTTTVTRNAHGDPESIANETGQTTEFEYDPSGRVNLQRFPDSREILFTYNEKGSLTSWTPDSGSPHGFSFDANEQRQFSVPPDVAPPIPVVRTEYKYNLDGQLTRVITPEGETLNLFYDPLAARVSSHVTSVGQTTFHYDIIDGALERITAPDGGTLTFDNDGSLPKGLTWAGAINGSVEHVFDSALRVVSQKVNGTDPVLIAYDDDSLVTSVGALTLSRDNETGLPTSLAIGVVGDARQYNQFGEETRQTVTASGVPIFDRQLSRDSLGRITSVVEDLQGDVTTLAYDYDVAGRLTDVTKDGTPAAQFTFDANSNIVGGFNEECSTFSASHDAQDRLGDWSCDSDQIAFTYTASGYLFSKITSAGTTTYSYDVLGNLRSVGLPGGTLIEYVIDGVGRRIGKKVNGALVQGYLYVHQIAPIAELDGTGAVVGRFVYGSRTTSPDYVIRGTDTFRIISDQLGSPRLVIDVSDGTIVQRTDYDAFGNILFEFVDPGFRRVPFGFAGGLLDEDTGLLRFGARDYDPSVARWTAKDPLGINAGDPNLYAYVLNDPVNLLDPYGLQRLDETSFSQELGSIIRTGRELNFKISLDKAKCLVIESIADEAVEYGIYLFIDFAGGAGLPYVGQSGAQAGISGRLRDHLYKGKLSWALSRFKLEGISLNDAENFVLDAVLDSQQSNRRTGLRSGAVSNINNPPHFGEFSKKNLKICKYAD